MLFFFKEEGGIRYLIVAGVQRCPPRFGNRAAAQSFKGSLLASFFYIGRKQRALDVLRRRHVPRRLIYRIPIAAVLLRSVWSAAGEGRPCFLRRPGRGAWTGPPSEYFNDLYCEPHLFAWCVFPFSPRIASEHLL